MNELKKKLIELVPEIGELKFGCEVLLENNVKRTISGSDNRGYYQTLESDLTLVEDGIEEIIGRPITLEDVLRAIEKTIKKGLLNPDLKRKSELWEIQRIIELWQLGKPLDDQPEEVIDFLKEILK